MTSVTIIVFLNSNPLLYGFRFEFEENIQSSRLSSEIQEIILKNVSFFMRRKMCDLNIVSYLSNFENIISPPPIN